MIEIKVNDRVVSVQETELLYSGSVDTHICRFTFDAGWDSFSKSAVFRIGGRAITAVIDEEGCCTLPWETLTRANIGLAVEVGVYGVSAAAEVLTTVWDSIGTVRDGSEIGNDAREPSAGVYEQVMAGIRRVDEKVVGVQNALDNLPAGSTLVINDLTTGGASAALSAEMGKVLGQRPNPQLLHNACFRNAVNQRGNATYTAIGYTVDRWQIVTANTSLAVGSEGITLTHSGAGGNLGVIRQFVERSADLYGKIVTVSILLSDGSFAYRTGKIPVTPPAQDTVIALATLDASGADGRYFALFEAANGDLRAQIKVPSGGEMTVAAVKLELGSVQTLAHQDTSGNWVLNEIPDYGEELVKCQRYQMVCPTVSYGQYWLAAAQSATRAKICVQLPNALRTIPALTFDTEALALTDNTSVYPITAVSVFAVSGNAVMLDLTTSGLTAGKVYTLRASAATKIIFDANL